MKFLILALVGYLYKKGIKIFPFDIKSLSKKDKKN